MDIVAALREAGGHPIITGGWVRDHLLGIASKDLDIEVFGLDAAGTCARTLERVARAAHRARTGEEAFTAGDAFLARALDPEVARDARADVVRGRHLISLGLEPGPEFGAILARCRDVQDETGWTEPEAIIARAQAQE